MLEKTQLKQTLFRILFSQICESSLTVWIELITTITPHALISYSTILCHTLHCKRGIVITTECLLFQIQMSEQNTLLCGELHDNLFLILRQLSSTLSYHLSN